VTMLVDQRILALQGDPQQVRSINEFTDSLSQELVAAEGTPGRALMRELLAGSLRRALDIGGAEPKRRFLETLAGNIHKFHLQEQQSLARVYPVEISSEYRNLASFVEDDEPAAASSVAAAAAMALEGGGLLGELRRQLAGLPQRPGPAAQELLPRLHDAETARVLEAADARTRNGFFGDLRLALFKLPDGSQKELLERFPDLRAEVVRLVESMTQEISRWLDEERAVARRGGSAAPLFPKVKALFQAVLTPAFLTTFKHLGGSEKRGKEGFLLKLALCLRSIADLAPREVGGEVLVGHASQLRRQFFHVEGYGELMADWLQNRIRQCNDEFVTRAGAALQANPQPILARLRRTFRPGRWLSLADPQVEDDLFALFLDDAFPRHVLTHDAVAKVLQRISSYGGATCEFQVFGSLARLPPVAGSVNVRTSQPQDAVEAALLQILQRMPPFPALRRLRPGHFLFGRMEVEFLLRGSSLLAKVVSSHHMDGRAAEELSAEDFFLKRGSEEYPNVNAAAIQASLQSPAGAPTTGIEAIGAPDPIGHAVALLLGGATGPGSFGATAALQPPLSMATLIPGLGLSGMGLMPLRGPAPLRYEPYPGAAGMASGMLPMPGFGHQPMGMPASPAGLVPHGGKFGLDDDEI